ncbi:MAG: hypothetical protein Q4C84_00955 [Bacillota bacterium]|nr:hypothetical protein [Bacillota bacterium]
MEEVKKKEKTENEIKKEYLLGFQKISRQLERLENELAEIRLNKYCPSCISDGMPHASGCSDLSSYMAKVDELEKKILKKKYHRLQKQQEIRNPIERMEDENEKDVLTYRYLRGMKWEDIAVKMNIGYRQILRIHGKALENFKMS